MIYLDNASTTRKKPRIVIKTIKKDFKKYSVNSGRGGYKIGIIANLKIFNLREKLCELFDFDIPENVVLTSGCTSAINQCLIGTVQPKKHIVITIFEHNSVLRTLNFLAKEFGVTYSVVLPNKDGYITSKEVEKYIKDDTYLVIINHTSNVTGITNDIKSIGELCKIKNIKFMVDTAQSAGHCKISIKQSNINILVFAGHKGLFGPQGIGGYIINDIEIKPTKFGGTGSVSEDINQPTTLPDGFESGTKSTINAITLLSAVNYIIKNQNKICNKMEKLKNYLFNELKQLKQIKIYSLQSNNSGVVSFNLLNYNSNDVSEILDEKYNICTRSGIHCAPLVHKYYNTLDTGMVRVSISYFTTKHEIKKLIKALKTLINIVK